MPSPLRCIVLDDERVAAESLARTLNEETDVVVLATLTDPQAALVEIRQTRPDVLFLDIRMPEMDAFMLLAALGPDVPNSVVFTTAFDDFALEAFDVAAVDYLLKPFTGDRLRLTLDRLRRRAGAALPDDVRKLLVSMAQATNASGYLARVPVSVRERIVLFDVEQICWFEAEGKYVNLHLSDKQVARVRHTMQGFEDQLDPTRFVRISRSAIVNIAFVQHFEPWGTDWVLAMKNGERITSTAGYRAVLKRLLKAG